MKRLILILALLCSPAFASVSLIDSNSNACSAVSTCTCALGAGVQNGDLLILGLQWGNQAGTLAITDNNGSTNTYTAFASSPLSDTAVSGNELFVNWSVNGETSGAITFTYTITGGSTHTMRPSCFAYRSTTGWPATPTDGQNTNVAAASSATTTSLANLTPSASGELLWGAVELSGIITANSITASGCTRQDTDSKTAGSGWGGATKSDSGDAQNATSSAQACNFGWSGTPNFGWAAMQGFFKPNAGGAASPAQPTMMSLGVGD